MNKINHDSLRFQKENSLASLKRQMVWVKNATEEIERKIELEEEGKDVIWNGLGEYQGVASRADAIIGELHLINKLIRENS